MPIKSIKRGHYKKKCPLKERNEKKRRKLSYLKSICKCCNCILENFVLTITIDIQLDFN